ncbi:MAG: response regulator, partial [Candidatus Saccharimonadales bacterium]
MKTILLAEDDSFIADIYATQLKKAGYRVDVAKDGEQALEKTRQTHPDLLVLDLVMPKLDGWQVLAEIRKDPAIQDTKVIVTSNLDQEAGHKNAEKFGVLKYFLKVETPTEELIQTVS